MKEIYLSPAIIDYGSILDHTFARAHLSGCVPDPNPNQNKQGDTRVCEIDKFCEYSCPGAALAFS